VINLINCSGHDHTAIHVEDLTSYKQQLGRRRETELNRQLRLTVATEGMYLESPLLEIISHVGSDEARGYVDGDTATSKFFGNRFGKPNDACFGSAVIT